MITHYIVDFGRQRMAVAEMRNGADTLLTVTNPLQLDERPDWIELDRQLMSGELAPIPEAS